MVVSDNQAGLRALRDMGSGRVNQGLATVSGIGRELGEEGKEVAFVWVPGHCGLTGNEWADEAAKVATTGDQNGVECMFGSVKRLWKRREVLSEWEHDRCRRVYGESAGIRWEEERGLSREDSVSLARTIHTFSLVFSLAAKLMLSVILC